MSTPGLYVLDIPRLCLRCELVYSYIPLSRTNKSVVNKVEMNGTL